MSLLGSFIEGNASLDDSMCCDEEHKCRDSGGIDKLVENAVYRAIAPRIVAGKR